MTDASFDSMIRQALAGDPAATAWIVDTALAIAQTSRDRQVVEIARAHLSGNADLVDALAREHLADFPDSVIVAWIAGAAADRSRGKGPRATP